MNWLRSLLTNERTRRRRVAILIISVLAFSVAGLLAGCNSVAGSGLGSSVVALWLASLSLIGFLVGCGGGGSGDFNVGSGAATSGTTTTPTPTPNGPNVIPTPTPTASPTPTPNVPAPAALAFQQQPTKINADKAEALTAITPPPTVAVLDDEGNIVTTATNLVTISLGQNPNGAVLSGTLSVNAVNGIATFSDLRISQAAAGFTLVATSQGLKSTESAVFTVQPLAFSYATRYDTPTLGNKSVSVAVGDFNGDGIADVATSNFNGNDISVLLGKGDGTYLAPQHYETLSAPFVIKAGDFNGDGRADLAVGNYQSQSVSVLLANADGSFQAALNLPAQVNPTGLAIGDLDHDGNQDIVVANYDSASVSLMFGNGNGTFKATQNLNANGTPESVALGDFNGDGNVDIFVSGYEGIDENSAAVLLGNGDGTFHSALCQNIDGRPPDVSVAVGDFNGDTKLDVAIGTYAAGQFTAAPVILLVGNGDGSFAAALNVPVSFGNFPIPSERSFVASGDFNGDGKLDLGLATVFGEGGRSTALVPLLGNGDATFRLAVPLPAAPGQQWISAADVTGDGKLDLVTANYGGNEGPLSTVSVFFGVGDGNFEGRYSSVAAQPVAVAEGDFNGDGKVDVVAATYNYGGRVSVLMGNGDGTFSAPANFQLEDPGAAVQVGDFNGDHKLDIAALYGSSGIADIALLLGNGDGTFTRSHLSVGGQKPYALAVADFNADGKADFAATGRYSNTVNILLGNGDGTFSAGVNYFAGFDPRDIAVADFNGDGKADLAIADSSDATVSILTGNGNGTFQAPTSVIVGGTSQGIVSNDFNRDGKADLVVTIFGGSGLQLLLGNGNGTFMAPTDLPSNAFLPQSLTSGDVNADGIVDVVATDYYQDYVVVLLGNGNGTFAGQVGLGVGVSPKQTVIGDVNGDGKPDFVTADFFTAIVSVILHR